MRHSFATEMVRLGVSLPALMQMLGHKDIRMTMRYVEVVQLDLQREFHRAVKTLAYSTPFPNSLRRPPQLLRASISLLFTKLSPLPDISSTYSSLSWRLRANVNFADSHSGS